MKIKAGIEILQRMKNSGPLDIEIIFQQSTT